MWCLVGSRMLKPASAAEDVPLVDDLSAHSSGARRSRCARRSPFPQTGNPRVAYRRRPCVHCESQASTLDSRTAPFRRALPSRRRTSQEALSRLREVRFHQVGFVERKRPASGLGFLHQSAIRRQAGSTLCRWLRRHRVFERPGSGRSRAFVVVQENGLMRQPSLV